MPKLNARSASITSQESCSAVIIADLVADVPVAVPHTVEDDNKPRKEETNLGYDNHMDGVTNYVENKKLSTDGVFLRTVRANETGISKGVILNAVQFGHSDSNGKIDEKPIQLTNSLSVQAITAPVEESKGFKEMSLLRKLAFGVSFLPSIMFVLCFAIILPCNVPKPCVETIWIRAFNNVEISSNVEIKNNVAFTILENNLTSYIELNAENGVEETKYKLPNKAVYVKCGNIRNKEEIDCFVTDANGIIYFLNSTTGAIPSYLMTKEGQTQPIILPDCNGDGIDEIAVVVSNTKLNVTSGYKFSNVDINYCDSVPSILIPWSKDGTTNIVLYCKGDGKDQIIKIPQNIWCDHDTSVGNTWTLHPKIESEKGLILYPTEIGLVLWSGNDVYLLQADGSEGWKTFNDSHSSTNRHILYGRFDGTGKQIALLSSDISSKLEITILNSTDGSALKSVSIPRTEARNVIPIQGHERDFVLTLMKTAKKDVVIETLEHINDISSTIVSYLSSEKITDSSLLFQNETVDELAFLELLDGTSHTIQKIKDTKNSIKLAAIQNGEILNIYPHSTVKYPPISEIRRIEVANWDVSALKASECNLK